MATQAIVPRSLSAVSGAGREERRAYDVPALRVSRVIRWNDAPIYGSHAH